MNTAAPPPPGPPAAGKATASAPANIAFIKYWGARDLDRALPLNPSISMTLTRCRSRTTVEVLPGPGEDEVLVAGGGDDRSNEAPGRGDAGERLAGAPTPVRRRPTGPTVPVTSVSPLAPRRPAPRRRRVRGTRPAPPRRDPPLGRPRSQLGGVSGRHRQLLPRRRRARLVGVRLRRPHRRHRGGPRPRGDAGRAVVARPPQRLRLGGPLGPRRLRRMARAGVRRSRRPGRRRHRPRRPTGTSAT